MLFPPSALAEDQRGPKPASAPSSGQGLARDWSDVDPSPHLCGEGMEESRTGGGSVCEATKRVCLVGCCAHSTSSLPRTSSPSFFFSSKQSGTFFLSLLSQQQRHPATYTLHFRYLYSLLLSITTDTRRTHLTRSIIIIPQEATTTTTTTTRCTKPSPSPAWPRSRPRSRAS